MPYTHLQTMCFFVYREFFFMGSIDIFASSSNFIISLISLIILGITLIIVSQGKLAVKKPLLYIYIGLVLEFITVGINYQTNVLYQQGAEINTWVFLELALLLIAMLFFVIASLRIITNTLPEGIIVGSLGCIGGAAIFYFVFIMPNSYMVLDMQQIFTLTSFLLLSIAFASKIHHHHNGGYMGGMLSCGLLSLILVLRLLGFGYEYDLLNNWYISPLFYNVMAVVFIAINADSLAIALDKSRSEITKYNLRIEEIIKSSPFPIIISRLSDDKIILANNNAVKLFGIDINELDRYHLKDFFADPESRLQLNERLESEKEVQDFEVLVRTYEGDSPFWLLTSATTIDYNYDVVLYAAFQDITSRKNREVLLKNQATRDPLTSLYNRRYFEDEVNKRIAAARNNNGTYCILMTDVDLFKRVNDTYGHKTGDKVLIELASACERALRDKDIVARYGGEEFVIYLDNVDIEDARIVAERLRQTISSLKVPSDDGRIVTFSISIGISSSQVSDNIDTLIKTADEALYKAKQNGRNRVELFLPDDLKNFNPDANNMHKSEAATRHPIFEKEGAEEISLLDGVAEKHIEGSPSEINHQPPRPQNNPPVSAPQNPQNPQNHNNNGQQ